MLWHTEVLKISVNYQIEYHHEKIEDSVGSNNLNPCSLELFFVSLQSPSYHCCTVLLLLHYSPGIRLYINNIKLSQGE